MVVFPKLKKYLMAKKVFFGEESKGWRERMWGMSRAENFVRGIHILRHTTFQGFWMMTVVFSNFLRGEVSQEHLMILGEL